MNIRSCGLAVLLACSLAAGSAALAAVPADSWLMMVVTRPTDPARDSEFNTWYNEVDIPDVLEVTGYERARRGRRTEAPSLPEPPADEGPYVALYDIVSPELDKIIIDMLMASRKMNARGRSTNLLDITEIVYYRHRARGVLDRRNGTGNAGYVFVERAGCSGSKSESVKSLRSYDTSHVMRMRRLPGVLRVQQYELYRVLMVEPKAASQYLTMYEIAASTDDDAARTAGAIISSWDELTPQTSCSLAASSRLYRLIKDVRRAPASAAERAE